MWKNHWNSLKFFRLFKKLEMVDLIGRTAIRNNRQENERFFEIMIQKFMIFLNLILNLISEFNCLIFLIKIKIKSNFLKLKS